MTITVNSSFAWRRDPTGKHNQCIFSKSEMLPSSMIPSINIAPTRRDVFKATFLLAPGLPKETDMYKMLAYWSAPRPEDVEAFERYYIETHIPLAAAVPHLLRLTSTRTSDALGAHSPYHYRVAEMAFGSKEIFGQSARSPEFAAMLKCSAEMRERFDVTLTAEAGDEMIFLAR